MCLPILITFGMSLVELGNSKFQMFFFADVVDHIIFGTVIQEVKTSNIAREVSL